MVMKTDPRYIFVVEKHAIFQRPTKDHVFNRIPFIFIPAKGYPDIATRFLLHRMSRSFPDLPILGLMDCYFKNLDMPADSNVAEEELKEVNKKYDKVKITLETQGDEDASKLVRGGKDEHNPCYLFGRLMRKTESKTKSSSTTSTNITQEYVSDLTAKSGFSLSKRWTKKLTKKFEK